MSLLLTLINSNKVLATIPTTDYRKRIDCIAEQLLVKAYHKVYYSLLNKDKYIYGLRLAQIRAGAALADEFKGFIKHCSLIDTTLRPSLCGGKLGIEQRKQIEELSKNPTFSGLINHMESNEKEWVVYCDSEEKMELPQGWLDEGRLTQYEGKNKEIARLLMEMCVVKAVRPDF